MEGKNIKVAIADDHTLMRKGLIELIDSFADFKVVIDAPDGQQLLEQIEKHADPIDVCLLDISMPVMNGYDTAREIRIRWPDMRILALSMYATEHVILKMLRAGANGYISKNTSPKALEQAMFGVYYKFYYHSELVSGRMIHALHTADKTDYNISPKEMEFLSYCISDLTYKEIAERMRLSNRTVEGYRDTLLMKLGLRTRSGLVVFGMSLGLVPKE